MKKPIKKAEFEAFEGILDAAILVAEFLGKKGPEGIPAIIAGTIMVGKQIGLPPSVLKQSLQLAIEAIDKLEELKPESTH